MRTGWETICPGPAPAGWWPPAGSPAGPRPDPAPPPWRHPAARAGRPQPAGCHGGYAETAAARPPAARPDVAPPTAAPPAVALTVPLPGPPPAASAVPLRRPVSEPIRRFSRDGRSGSISYPARGDGN